MTRLKRPFRRLGAVLLVALLLPFSALPAAAADGAHVPAGFVDEAMFSGLDHPTAVVFAANGNAFVAQKNGTILFYTSVSDTTPTVFADLTTNVHNYWDRGLLGMAVDPDFPAKPYVYVLYSYNHILGDDPLNAPRWPSADPPGSPSDDRCPSPPAATTDGCVISGRLSRLTASGGAMTGPEKVLIEDWCDQFPSHSVGNLMFGPEGALYVSGGDGASFNKPDYGQLGGTLADTPTPSNPCGDPPGPAGTLLSPPTAEGGALRSQDLRTSGDPVSLDGTVLRIDPSTGDAWPTNALIDNADANARKIIGYGLRNPFRFTIRPGTSEVWIGDVGFASWEEIDRLVSPSAAPRNFGWPCWEGNDPQAAFQSLGLAICDHLTAGSVSLPFYTYKHSAAIVANDGCKTGGSSISGLTFLSSTSGYPDAYDRGLFMSDYTRQCIWFFPAGSGGVPIVSTRSVFANLAPSATSPGGGSVFLTTAPNGDLVYVDFDRGQVRTIRYTGEGVPPVARFSATPAMGPAPLDVTFDASTSAGTGALTYAWDLDGDGQYDDASGVTATRSYAAVGNTTVRLLVTDPFALTDTTSKTISAGNAPPVVAIGGPAAALTWKVGDTIAFSGSATDSQDGALPPSAFVWTLTMRHCPDACHSHIIETFTGVTSGSFVAPDHEVPSHLLLSVSVTDSNGSIGTDQVELYPQTGTVTVATSPAGMLTTAGDVTGDRPTATGIVGSVVTVAAPLTASMGEGTWTFTSWSDGGARTHAVPVTAGDQVLTATYKLTSTTDAANSCASASAAIVPTGRWQVGRFATSGDADWYRFKLTATTRVRVVLGDLPVAGRLELYKGCGTLLQVSDRGGLGSEEIIRNLPAGSYAIRIQGNGTSATANHALLMQKLGSGVRVLSSRARVEGGTLRLVGEVYNNTSKSVGPVTVSARIYDAAGKLLTTRSAGLDLAYLASNSRAPFSIVGSMPAGYDHVVWTVSAPTTTHKVTTPAWAITTSAPDASGHWVVKGTLRNTASNTVSFLGLGLTMYDGRLNVLDVRRATLPVRTLTAGASTTFSATFLSSGLSPNKIYPRSLGLR